MAHSPAADPPADRHRLRVLVADDSAPLRQLFAMALADDPRIELVGTVRDGLEAVESVRADCPEAVLLDVEMPRMDGLAAASRIRSACPAVTIVVVSSHPPETLARAALAAGADAYWEKRVPDEGLAEALLAVHRR